jgi:acetoin utilization deacetylase AcuC-like enzyme/ribosomal protein S18 acetylase RimI-like enzyme
MPLIVNDKHDIHHIRERGYVESPVRISAILSEIDKTGLFARTEPRHFGERYIREVHDGALVDYIRTACAEAPQKTSVYPYVFPVRNAARKPKERSVLAGYWCIDTFTPINRNAWPAARRAADCAITAADEVLNGAHAAYALIRPPGHHAEHRTFGGFCYICNGAVAANYLSHYGTVAILDIDYHHGNGQQDIFYERGDVLTVSIHGDPSFAYPYFTGFREEHGRGEGAGYNLNIPLPEVLTPEQYREALERAFRRIDEFQPDYLVVSVGFDTGRGDPTGTWGNRPADFRLIGRRIGAAGYPTAVIQEGGYRVRTLGANARSFFEGVAEGIGQSRGARHVRPKPVAERGRRSWRSSLRPEDPPRIRALVIATGMFSAEEEKIAEELAAERVERGRVSGYEFILAFEGERLVGYACYGKIPGSELGWDLYWIAVAPGRQGKGLGGRLLERTETAIRRAGGRTLWADTSSRATYDRTRAFYAGHGFTLAADLVDFYRAGDGKALYRKELAP